MLGDQIKNKLKEVQKLRKLGKFDEALAEINKIDISGENIEKGVAAYVLYQKGLILSSLGDTQNAHQTFQKALDVSQSSTQRMIIKSGDLKNQKMILDAFYILQELIAKNKKSSGKNMAEVLSEELLKNVDLKIALNLLEKFKGRNFSEELFTAFEKLAKKNPHDAFIWSILGDFYVYYDDYKKALEAYKKGYDSPYKKFDSCTGIINCHINFRNIDQAKQYLSIARKIASDQSQQEKIEDFNQIIQSLEQNQELQTVKSGDVEDDFEKSPPPPDLTAKTADAKPADKELREKQTVPEQESSAEKQQQEQDEFPEFIHDNRLEMYKTDTVSTQQSTPPAQSEDMTEKQAEQPPPPPETETEQLEQAELDEDQTANGEEESEEKTESLTKRTSRIKRRRRSASKIQSTDTVPPPPPEPEIDQQEYPEKYFEKHDNIEDIKKVAISEQKQVKKKKSVREKNYIKTTTISWLLTVIMLIFFISGLFTSHLLIQYLFD
ncbi:MAG: hypothetical protein APR63_07625 [Desulfuromonas sp. SDB]|nr:MAG: hypothetical protein APR63_07625 [Desulfuromonas sp. SDB]